MKANLPLITVFLLLLILINCSNHRKGLEKIEINIQNQEMCYFFFNKNNDTLKFNRVIKIVKNTLTDSILIGHSVLPPNYLGQIEYTKLRTKDDIVLDLNYENPKADRICVNSYNGKKSQGILVLKLIDKDD